MMASIRAWLWSSSAAYATLFCAFACPGMALAASGAVAGGSGTTLLERVQAIRMELDQSLAPDIAPHAVRTQGIVDEATALHARLREFRGECAEELRRSNRDAWLPTYLRCLRSLLLQESRLTQLRLSAALDDRGIEPEHGEAASKADALIDALSALVTGIDADLFGSRELAGESAARLHKQYRVPFAVARHRLRARREQGWIKRIAARIETRVLAGPLAEAAMPELEAGLSCLGNAAMVLDQVKAENDYLKIILYFSQYETAVPGCLKHIKNAKNLDSQQPPADSSVGSSASSEKGVK